MSRAQRALRPALRQALRAPLSRRAAAELLYALASVPLAVVACVYVLATALVTVPAAITRAGPAVEAAVLRGARRFGDLDRALAAWLLGEPIPAPEVPRAGGLRGWVRAARDPASFRAGGYLLLKLPLALLGLLAITYTWVYGLIALTYPIQLQLGLNVSTTRDDRGRIREGLVIAGLHFDTWQRGLLISAGGLALLLIAPQAVRAAVRLDLLAMRGLLGPRPTSQRIRDLEETRALAVEDAAATLRQIERDLHDGAQVRLVGLAMNLAVIGESLPDGTPEATRKLVGTAHDNARAAIRELRELVRGIHPPVLDKGLDTALASLAARSPVPVELDTRLPVRPSAAIESIAYFCTSELLANVAKHSGAGRARVDVSAAEDGGTLRLRVTDDGRGGARVHRGAGLGGLADRVRTVDGEVRVDSPPGGPTTVTVTLPLHTS